MQKQTNKFLNKRQALGLPNQNLMHPLFYTTFNSEPLEVDSEYGEVARERTLLIRKLLAHYETEVRTSERFHSKAKTYYVIANKVRLEFCTDNRTNGIFWIISDHQEAIKADIHNRLSEISHKDATITFKQTSLHGIWKNYLNALAIKAQADGLIIWP